MPVKGALTKADTTYTVTADLAGFAADKLVMNQKLEANALKVVANNAGLSGQGRRQDQRAAGLAGLSQADRGRCRHQAAGDARRRQPRAARVRSRPRGQRRHSGQADRQDRQRRSRQPHRHRGRSDRAEARQHPAGLGQAAGQVEQARPSTWCRSRNRPGLEDIVDRRRRRLDQGIARGRPERRPDQRQLPDLFAVRRRQDLAEGRARRRWRA